MKGKKDNMTDPEPQEDDWMKKLGAIPADQSYEQSPEATQIETAPNVPAITLCGSTA